MPIDQEIANPAALGYLQNALNTRRQQTQQNFANNLATRDQQLQEQQVAAHQNALSAQQSTAQQKMNAEQALAGARIVQQAAKKGQDPKAVAEAIAPNFVQDFEKTHGAGSWQALQPGQVLSMVEMLEQKSMAQLGISPEKPSAQMETIEGPDGAILQRDPATGELKQVMGRGQNSDMNAYQRSQLDLQRQQMAQQRELTMRGQDLTAQSAANKSNTATAQTQQQNQRTLEVYDAAMSGLKGGLSGTNTGAIMGRIPAFTTEQQIAEGAVSAMAPVLKQLFRSAGEGTFTDKDQELLLNMVPTRKDTPEAREAKIQNIDNIVRAKLGVGGQQSSQSQPVRVNTPQEAMALPAGTRFVTPDGRVKVR